MKKRCVVCGKEYYANRRDNRKYCSDTCLYALKKQKYIEEKKNCKRKKMGRPPKYY